MMCLAPVGSAHPREHEPLDPRPVLPGFADDRVQSLGDHAPEIPSSSGEWATERKELPLKDVAAAGGWNDVTTLLTCYQHADEATMLKVMASPTNLVSGRTAGAVEKL